MARHFEIVITFFANQREKGQVIPTFGTFFVSAGKDLECSMGQTDAGRMQEAFTAPGCDPDHRDLS